MFWVILGALSVMGAIAVIYALSVNQKENQEDSSSYQYDKFGEDEGLGAPLFTSMKGRKPLVRHLATQSKVFALTPVGPLEMRVKWSNPKKGQIENDEYIVDVHFDTRYFSDTVADKLSHHTGAWRVSNIFKKTGHVGRIAYTNKARWNNRYWLEDESSLGIDDLFDILIFYELMFNNFNEPYDYYGEMEPTWDFPAAESMVPEEVFVEPTDEGEPSKPYEPPVEEPVVEEVVAEEPAPAPAPEPEVEEVRHDPEPVADWSSSDDSDSSGGWADDGGGGGSDDW